MLPATDRMCAPAGSATLSPRQLRSIIAALMLGMFLGALDQTIVATALPTIANEFRVFGQLSWIASAYMVASTVSLPLYGKLGDLFGRKVIFEVAIGLFILGSVLCGAARSVQQLAAFRALQGVGGGGLLITAVAMIADLVSPRERGRYQGYFGGVFAAASVLGPLVGGWLTDHISWRWVFYVNLPFGVAALLMTAIYVPAPRARRAVRVDYVGAALMAGVVGCLMTIALNGGGRYAWSSPLILGSCAATVVFTVAFLLVEARVSEPVLPLSLFRNATFNIAAGTLFVVGFGLFGVISFLPVFLQIVNGADATRSGLLLLPFLGGMVSASIACGRLISKTGRYKIFPVVGSFVATLGMFSISRLDAGTPRLFSSLALLATGVGIGCITQVMVVATQNSVELSNVGTATSIVGFCRSIGGSLGVAVFGSIFNAGVPPRFAGSHRAADVAMVAHALDTMFLSAVPVLALGFLFVLFLHEVPLRRARPATPLGPGSIDQGSLEP